MALRSTEPHHPLLVLEGEEAFNQIKASYIHKPQVGAIHDHQQRYSTIIMGSAWTARSGDDNTAEVNIYYYYG